MPRRARADLLLATGDLDAARERALRDAAGAKELQRLADWAQSTELAMRALARLQDWQTLVDLAGPVIDYARDANYRNLAWRLLALRAQAHEGRGGAEAAVNDRTEGREILDQVLSTITQPEHRESYQSDPLAAELYP